jgi:AraC family transcriptional regulator
MPKRYQDTYPSPPLINSEFVVRPLATELLRLEFFEAEPGEMPQEAYAQHHILINLREQSHRVENWREDQHRDFTFHKNEIIVTPAGIKSGWKWHSKSKVIVITLDPNKLEQFAKSELGIVLSDTQLKDVPQFIDEDITQAGILVMEALNSDLGSAVMFESYARIFLTKLIQSYGLELGEDISFSSSFTAKHYKAVLEYISMHYGKNIVLEDIAAVAAMSTYHFSRLFKQTIGQSPHQFLMAYRIERAKEMLATQDRAMIDIAHLCGFSDQAHFSRVFKQIQGTTPKQWRQSQ